MNAFEGAIQVIINAVAQAQMLRDGDTTGAAVSAIRAYRAGLEEWEIPTPVTEASSSTSSGA